MTARARPPIAPAPPRLRQRRLAGGAWRVWWEPCAAARRLGFGPAGLDAARPTWSAREAARLNAEVAAARAGAAPGAKARQREPRAEARTVAALIGRFTTRPDYAERYRPATREDYARGFRLIARRWGQTRAAGVAKPAVHAWYEDLYRTSGRWQAAALVRKLSVLMAYAERIGWIAEGANPCLRLAVKAPPPRATVLGWDDLARLMAACRAPGLVPGMGGRAAFSMGAAIALSALMGQRQADIVAARASEFEGSVWRLLRAKRGTLGAVPAHPLAAPWLRLAARRARSAGQERLLVHEGTGQPYRPDHFRRVFARVRAAAGLDEGVQFRDLRRTFGHLARIGGASARDVADALGNTAWKDPRLSGTYMPPSAETAARAVRAIAAPASLLKQSTLSKQSTLTGKET
jgi:integrase